MPVCPGCEEGFRAAADGSHVVWHNECNFARLTAEKADRLYRAEARVEQLKAALAPFAAIDGVAVPRMKLPPEQDRLWSYYDSRNEKQYEITRAHIIEAARVLKTLEK